MQWLFLALIILQFYAYIFLVTTSAHLHNGSCIQVTMTPTDQLTTRTKTIVHNDGLFFCLFRLIFYVHGEDYAEGSREMRGHSPGQMKPTDEGEGSAFSSVMLNFSPNAYPLRTNYRVTHRSELNGVNPRPHCLT